MTAPSPRPYRKRKRAKTEEETRLRITEAAVELHGTVGPAQTKLTDVAKLAGVSRMTIYNHFPSEVDLFTACSTHWASQNPFPDPSTWTLTDPAERLVVALKEVYTWYGLKQGMLARVLRDVPIVPALAEVMGGLWEPYMEGIVEALAEGWNGTNVTPDELRALLQLGVDFHSWQVLTGSGLDDPSAAELMARVLTEAASGER